MIFPGRSPCSSRVFHDFLVYTSHWNFHLTNRDFPILFPVRKSLLKPKRHIRHRDASRLKVCVGTSSSPDTRSIWSSWGNPADSVYFMENPIWKMDSFWGSPFQETSSHPGWVNWLIWICRGNCPNGRTVQVCELFDVITRYPYIYIVILESSWSRWNIDKNTSLKSKYTWHINILWYVNGGNVAIRRQVANY